MNRLNSSLLPSEFIDDLMDEYNMKLNYDGVGYVMVFEDPKKETVFRLKYSQYL